MKKHMALFLILIWTLIWALCVAPALAEPEALTISGGVYYDVMSFEEKHPEIEVNQLEEWPDATEMIRRITSQDDSVVRKPSCAAHRGWIGRCWTRL